MKFKKTILVFSLFWTLILIVTVTYSWIARSWTPQLEYQHISIATTGSLMITFENETGDESVFNEVNVNELAGLDKFALKQVSSVDGKNFLSANFNPILEGKVPVYDSNINGKYIETEFWLKTQYETDEDLRNMKKEVFIHKDSYIQYNPESNNNEASLNSDLTIRIAIEIQNVNDNVPYIFCADRSSVDATNNNTDGNDGIYEETLYGAKTIAENYNVFTNYPSDTTLLKKVDDVQILDYQKAYKFSYFDGSSADKVLFSIDAASAQKVTVRIWLEGCDDYCLNPIAGKDLSILLKFDSREVVVEETE